MGPLVLLLGELVAHDLADAYAVARRVLRRLASAGLLARSRTRQSARPTRCVGCGVGFSSVVEHLGRGLCGSCHGAGTWVVTMTAPRHRKRKIGGAQ
jgi:hypothetical protein